MSSRMNGDSEAPDRNRTREDGTYEETLTFEAFHATFVLADSFQTHVAESRCAAEYPAVEAAAEAALAALWHLYEVIGNVGEAESGDA